jgi:diguanylate cyclase (GGDEF)-like protein
MKKILEYINKMPETTILAIGFLMFVLLGFIDLETGYEISFSIFYLLPVIMVSWRGKKMYAVIISVLSAVTWLWADLEAGHPYSHLAMPVWNSIMILGFYLIVVFTFLAIKALLEKEQSSARVDFITGVFNSRAFHEMAQKEINRAARFNHPVSMAYIDIDNFKQMNDAMGHGAGDVLLNSVAATIKQNIRSVDIVSRLGGDEFAILMPETDGENARTAINKVQKYLLGAVQQENWPVTFSIGVVTCHKLCNLNEFIREADNLMYAVKESGKNGVEYKIHEPSNSIA